MQLTEQRSAMRNVMHNAMKAATVPVLLAVASAAAAMELTLDANVTRTLAAADEKFGGCMVWLTKSPAIEGMDCNTGNWVTFSCTGEHVSKSSALRMFDAAQLAFVTERTVRVTVDDSRKHNGWCQVARIDVFAE